MNREAPTAGAAVGRGRAWRSLRVQLAVAGFLAIYVPVLVLLGVTLVTADETVTVVDGVEVTETSSAPAAPWSTGTAVALGPAAAGLAWWWAGRAVRPLDRVRSVADHIGATDLGRRIGLDRGPGEVVALAASFDAMLDRLAQAAQTQRQLIEETSHELRTPLSVLAANADVLLAHPDPTVDLYREGLERSRTAAARMRDAIDELLVDARGRARTIDRAPADLMAVVRTVADDAGVLASAKGVDVAVTGPSIAECPLDEPTVRRAVANLVDNAVRHAPAGSTVAMSVAVVGRTATVAVSDRGPGIPPALQDQVFERFWRGRPDMHGTGLGLPIARQVASAHGGDVTVRSPGPQGDGSVFELTVRW